MPANETAPRAPRIRVTNWAAALDSRGTDRPRPAAWSETITFDVGSARVLRLHGEKPDALPAFARNPRYAVIFDGVFFEREDRLRELDLPPGATDADILLALYGRDGEGVLPRLRGHYAFVIYDGEKDVCLWARDHAGWYPLFYAARPERWLISTAIEALLAFPDVPKVINRIAVVNRILHRWENETFFEGIERVLPANAARLDGGALSTFRYWRPMIPRQRADWLGDEVMEVFTEHFRQAVTRRLGLGRPAIFLSGGLDSISVAAAASDTLREHGCPPLLALSLAFPGAENDESMVQKAVAEHLGLPHALLGFGEAFDTESVLLSALAANRYFATPLVNTWMPGYLRLGFIAREEGGEIILTGSGGDEWLGVTPLLAADLIRSLDLVGLFQLWRAGSRSYTLSRFRLAENLLWKSGLRQLVKRAAEQTVPTASKKRTVAAHLRSIPKQIPADPTLHNAYLARVRNTAQAHDEVRTGSVYFDEVEQGIDHPLVSIENEENFTAWHRHGLPILHPYWDATLIELLYRVPPPTLNSSGRSKGLVRALMAERFQGLNLDRQKKSLASNLFSRLLERETEAIRAELHGLPALVDLGIVGGSSIVSSIVELCHAQPYRARYLVWELVNAEMWLRAHL